MAKGLVTCVVLAALALPGVAQAATPFGANVEAAQPGQSFFCGGQLPPFGAVFGVPTCTALSAGRFGDGAGSHLVPSGFGVITRVDVRMPDATGPMQITVLRANRAQFDTVPACCYHAGESQVFTPAAGQVTSVPVRIPVKSELTVTGVYEYDAISISALSAQTPIPAASAPGSLSGGYFPHVSAGQERFESQASLGEIQIMLRGTWEPDADRDGLGDETQDRCPGAAGRRSTSARAAQCAPPGSGGGTAGTGPAGTPPSGVPGPAPTVALARRTAAVRGGRARLRLRCGAAPCAGTLRLQSRSAGRRSGRRTFGTARVSIPANAARTVGVRLNRAGRALLRRRRSVRVWLNLSGARPLSVRVRLRR